MNDIEQCTRKGGKMVEEVKQNEDPLDMAADLLFGAIQRLHTANAQSLEPILRAAEATAQIDTARTLRRINANLEIIAGRLERMDL